jgi:dienelactone hydrolase
MWNIRGLLPFAVPAAVLALAPHAAFAQAEPQALAALLSEPILPPAVALHELRQHIVARVAKPPAPASAEEWTREAGALRARLLGEVVFHGWPREWVEAAPRFEETGVIEAKGYRIRKLRYEIVPGLNGAALLYEPSDGRGRRRPAVLNVNGHVGAEGKAVEYKQKRCITFARNGVLALDLEWLGMGELAAEGSSHWYAGHLDLVGVHELGLFYLAMRRGLDYLYEHPAVDRERIGMTGLSGGGWQTIVLSALDERVRASAPVAGFNGIGAKAVARAFGDTGDPEQSATDLFAAVDYPHLAALTAPRPLLLAFNAEDDCCFRSGMVKPTIEELARRVYELYGRAGALAWHENREPGTHNYQLDNREQAYRFFSGAFGLAPPIATDDEAAASELRGAEELAVGLPADNLTILGLARRFAAAIRREPRSPEAARARLLRVVRHAQTRVEAAWLVASTIERGVEALSYLLRLGDGLSVEAVRMRAVAARGPATATILIGDGGRARLAAEAAARVNRGETVLAVDLAFVGEAWAARETRRLLQNLNGLGERPLGVQAAQLSAVAGWLKRATGAPALRLEARGPRSQSVALVASGLEPGLFSELLVRDGLASFAELLDRPVEYMDAPELFCLDLYRELDLPELAALSGPARVIELRSAIVENP